MTKMIVIIVNEHSVLQLSRLKYMWDVKNLSSFANYFKIIIHLYSKCSYFCHFRYDVLPNEELGRR